MMLSPNSSLASVPADQALEAGSAVTARLTIGETHELAAPVSPTPYSHSALTLTFDPLSADKQKQQQNSYPH